MFERIIQVRPLDNTLFPAVQSAVCDELHSLSDDLGLGHNTLPVCNDSLSDDLGLNNPPVRNDSLSSDSSIVSVRSPMRISNGMEVGCSDVDKVQIIIFFSTFLLFYD